MLWVKALHIIFMVTWFAGLFYLPRLFVYHSSCEDAISVERFKLMERRLFYGIMTPASLLTIISGLFLWVTYGITGFWLYAKLVLVLSIIIYQIWCGFMIQEFKHNRNRKSPMFYRWFNEYPTVVLVTVVLLSVVKPV
tara:strand:+ start:52 stop:465 length:414 start_codon:yes stop_codon:yes gene_type:complete